MKYDDLTSAQKILHDEVEQKGGWTGEDLRDVLVRVHGCPEDKAAVADVFGGAGAGDEFRESK